jgi:hypothetical protein
MRQRSAHSGTPPYKNKRVLALLAAVVVCGGLLTVTQVSNAGTNGWNWGKRRPSLPACPPANAGGATQGGSASPSGSASNNGVTVTTQNGRQVRQYRNDDNPGQQIRRGGNNRNPRPTCTPTTPANGSASPSSSSTTPPLEILATDCSDSELQAHTGFQDGNRCVSTAIGEVAELAKNATAMITDFPEDGVNVNQPFTLRISTRNLIRDRFLAAGAGGYYAETALLNGQGLVRGHAHIGCRVVNNTNEAPAPVRSDFFVALEDGAGSANPDQININVTGLPRTGTAICSVWAGDGTHKTPSAQFANTQPAFDVVRFEVR